MSLKTYLKKYFISDLVIISVIAGLCYLPSLVSADDMPIVDQLLQYL